MNRTERAPITDDPSSTRAEAGRPIPINYQSRLFAKAFAGTWFQRVLKLASSVWYRKRNMRRASRLVLSRMNWRTSLCDLNRFVRSVVKPTV